MILDSDHTEKQGASLGVSRSPIGWLGLKHEGARQPPNRIRKVFCQKWRQRLRQMRTTAEL